MTRRQKQFVGVLAAILVVVLAFGRQQGWWVKISDNVTPPQPGLYAIDHFVDGDTIAVKMNGKTETVRMIGVDTPETHKPGTPVQCYGPAAAAYTQNIINTQSVRLQADDKSSNRDRYGRLLRYVYLPGGQLVEAELIKNGYGFAYTQFPFAKSEEFVQYQTQAKAANKGLWGDCRPFQEGSGRWQTNNAS